MKKLLVLFVFVLVSINFISASSILLTSENEGRSGAIWTTRNDCGTQQQNVNQYNIGEDV